MQEIILSIYVATYNHEKYIGQALDGILKQKTKYNYEVLIGEDCSKDNTRQVLQEYERRYPGKFQIFYRERNMYNDEINNGEDLKRRCKGKYIIALEGDDYWIDPYKIEKQISFLEENPDYVAVAHNCVVVDEFSNPNGETYPECKDNEYTIRHFASEIMPGQLTTVMYRNFYAFNVLDSSLCKMQLSPGDQCTYFSLVSNGKVHCIQEVMSAYRHITHKGTSFSATYKFDYSSIYRLGREFINYAERINNPEAKEYAEFIYMRNIYLGAKQRQISIRDIIRDVGIIEKKKRALWRCMKFIINKKVLKRYLKV